MQSNPQMLFVKNPSAAIVEVGTGDFLGEVRLDDQITILASSVNKCDILCAKPCIEDVWTITFNDVDFGTCNDCGKTIGFSVKLKRDSDFDNETYLNWLRLKQYVYTGSNSGIVTGAQLATYFLEYMESLVDQNDQHDQFFVMPEIGALPNQLVLTYPCSGLVTYILDGIFQIADNNLTAAELPVVVHTVQGEDSVLTKERLRRQFPQEAGHIFGEAPRDWDMWCDTICTIKLKGCIDACSDFFDNQNSGHLHTASTPFDLILYVDSSAAGFPAFIAALNVAFTSCTLSLAPGYQDGWQAEVLAGTALLTMADIVFDAAGSDFTISNGLTTLTVLGVTSGAALQAALTAAFPPGTFVFAGGPPPTLTVSGVFAATGSGFITLAPAGHHRNYVGE